MLSLQKIYLLQGEKILHLSTIQAVKLLLHALRQSIEIRRRMIAPRLTLFEQYVVNLHSKIFSLTQIYMIIQVKMRVSLANPIMRGRQMKHVSNPIVKKISKEKPKALKREYSLQLPRFSVSSYTYWAMVPDRFKDRAGFKGR